MLKHVKNDQTFISMCAVAFVTYRLLEESKLFCLTLFDSDKPIIKGFVSESDGFTQECCP